ncbi:hypothetical protein CYLTODRAFT_398948 [Cylindrobasidium torrendii FP15055 ss-10]|uniref:Kinetochore protein Spc24 n=1 Tax=Cylindrobasidium torrendii FP15055 ss-10 TaxID=1314674 RepID=A0A0D7B7T1_9AGAR|nr:hypothetical protein CYLTODRAFT_398948 [Cylindrobasidium torrendii FP15055 ss-10]
MSQTLTITSKEELRAIIETIKDAVSIANPEQDQDCRILEEMKINLKQQRQERNQEIRDTKAKVKGAQQVLEQARQAAERPQSAPSAETMAARLEAVDAEMHTTCKHLENLDALVQSKTVELAENTKLARELESRDVSAEHREMLDGTTLRMRMFTRLGFRTESERADGVVSKIIAADHFGQRVESVDLGQYSDVSDFELTKRLWDVVAIPTP